MSAQQAVSGARRDETAGPAVPARWRRWAWPAGYAVAAVALFFCYLRLSGTQKVTSDGASMALQAWDMLHGNLLLHGWTVADVSFWTTELPEYALIEAVRGLGAPDVHVAAAITYTLLVVGAGLVAKGRATGAEGLARVLIASGIMIAPQLGQGTLIVLLAPDHTGTGVPLLVTWLILDRAGRRWWVPPAIGLLLAWTLVGDRVAEVLAVLPLVLVYGVRAAGGLIRREPRRQVWFDVSMACAAVGAYVASIGVGALVVALSGFRLQPVRLHHAPVSVLAGNALRTADGVLALFGAEFYRQQSGVAVALGLVHLVGLAMAVVAVGIGLRRFPRSDDPLVSVLSAGFVINIAVYLFSTMPVSAWSTREIAGVLPAGAVLAGRLLAGPVVRARLGPPLLAAAGAVYLVALGYGMAQPQLPAEGQNLADWLVARHLSNGLTGYGFGPTTTLASGGRVQLRQAAFSPGRVSPGPEEDNLGWYDPSAHDATFLVLAPRPSKWAPLTPARARGIFGPPAHAYRVDGQFVVWTYRYNLLARVR
ncbi:MAG: hypothetical protein J2P25_12545 [Nocardiopsaceae bacterium]|nr:hypothetical protein [Nocardiopsaceae bacterium]